MKNFIKKVVLGLAAVTMAVAGPYTALAWGPTQGAGRQLFDFNDPANYPQFTTFNAFTNNPVWGFEPDFMSIRRAGTSTWAPGDIIRLEPGQVYDVVVHYHNAAPCGTHPSVNARLAIEFPSVVRGGQDNMGNAIITANNSTPNRIWSSLTFRADSDVLIRYNPGSARLHHEDGSVTPLPNEGRNLFSSQGQQLGRNFNGQVMGCTADSGFIMFQITADQPNFEADKQVRQAGTTEWHRNIDAENGDILEFMLTFRNTGTTAMNNIRFLDRLQDGLEFVPGSTRMRNSAHPNGTTLPDGITENGILDPNTFHPGAASYILFQARVTADPDECEIVELYNQAEISSNLGTIKPRVYVRVPHPVQHCPEDPGTPPPPPPPPPPNVPGELPTTGAAGMAAGAVGVASMGTAAAHYIASRRKLKAVR